MTRLEQEILDEIRDLAINDPQKLIEKYIDMEKLLVCKRRKMGQTLQQIAIAMSTPEYTPSKKKVWKICQSCEE